MSIAFTSKFRTVDHLSLLAQPALGHFVSPLQHHVIALDTASKIVPGGGNEGVLALKILNDLVTRSLCNYRQSLDNYGKRKERR